MIDLRLTLGNTESVTQATQEGLADIGLVEGAVQAPTLSLRKVGTDQLIVVTGPAHEWCTAAKLTWDTCSTANGYCVNMAVLSGNYVTAISELVAAPHLAAGTLVKADFTLPQRQFLMLSHNDRYQTKALKSFADMLMREPDMSRTGQLSDR
ncbi:lysR substrate binding domain-containing protein [Ditylenchus destructor]|nr:lysR substrate binding domain-containing protein [Ditylenchus destructor]